MADDGSEDATRPSWGRGRVVTDSREWPLGALRGLLLENTVYMHLRRQSLAPEYYVTGQGYEVVSLPAQEPLPKAPKF